MLGDYRTLLTRYFGDLEKASVASWFPGFTPSGHSNIAALPAKTDLANVPPGSGRPSRIKLRPQLLWKNEQIRLAGNVFAIPDSRGDVSSLMVFDGWQTVRQFSPEGKLIGEKALGIPENEALTSWRSVQSADGKTLNAFYSIDGPRVWFFDESMQPKFTLPARDEKPARVMDIQVITKARQDDQLLICLLYTSPSPRDATLSRMPSSA